MNIYFFKNLPSSHRAAFRNYYTLQNLKAIQVACIVFFSLNLFLRLFYTFVPENLTRANNYPEFNYTNWIYLTLTPLFYVISIFLVSSYQENKKAIWKMSLFVLVFGIYILVSGLMASFINLNSPRSNLLFFLIALIMVSVTFVFESEDIIMLTIAFEVIFSLILFNFVGDTTEMLYNHLTFIVLLSSFYFISRYAYSYKASHYLQLKEITQKNIEIERAGDFKNDVLGIVAHDLRNPIAAIESIAMMMQLEDLDEDTNDNLDMIKTSCVKARSIVNDLLEVAQNENDRTFETQRLELIALLGKIIEEWKTHHGSNNAIILTAPKHLVFSQINLEKFTRVFDNLISNAIKFSLKNDKIDIFLSTKADNAIIAVRDYGVGIPKDLLPHIFERFTKAGRKGLRGEKSTGLGLSIARQIIEKHGGKLEVESEENQGTTFRITLPLDIIL